MSKHTICVRGSRRVVIQPSRTSPGVVSIVILGADRQEIASVSIDVVDIGVLCSALYAVAIELDFDGVYLERRVTIEGGALMLPVLGEVT